MIFTRLSALLAFSGLASAHFQLTYPPTRGFIQDNEPTPPCGGFNVVNTTRTPFPLGNTFIKLASEHEQANVLVMISFVAAPTDIKNFTLTPSGAAQPPLRDFFQINGSDICIQVDVGSIGYPNATEGAKATISVQYAGGDGNLFQCSDIIFTANATVPSNVTCTDEYLINATATSTGSSPSATTTTHSGVGQLTVGLGFGGIVLASLGAALFAM